MILCHTRGPSSSDHVIRLFVRTMKGRIEAFQATQGGKGPNKIKPIRRDHSVELGFVFWMAVPIRIFVEARWRIDSVNEELYRSKDNMILINI